VSQTKFPKDQMRGSSECVAGKSALASGCGFTTFGAQCTCPVCVADKQYACNDLGCPANGTTDGTITCNADGTGFVSKCDCKTPSAYFPAPPPAAPAPPPPGSGGSPAGAVLLGLGACTALAAAIGVSCYWKRRKHAEQLHAMNQNLLNSLSGGETAGDAAGPLPAAPEQPRAQ